MLGTTPPLAMLQEDAAAQLHRSGTQVTQSEMHCPQPATLLATLPATTRVRKTQTRVSVSMEKTSRAA